MNECEVYFYKEGIKGLAFKGISYITDFSEASVPLIIGLSITRPNQKAEWGVEGDMGVSGEENGGSSWESALERHSIGFSLVMSVFFFLKK